MERTLIMGRPIFNPYMQRFLSVEASEDNYSASNPCVMAFKNLSETVKFATQNIDREKGQAFNHETDEWTDEYSFDEFIQHFYEFKNKNPRIEFVEKVTGYLQKYIDQYKNHLMPQNIFNEEVDVSGSTVDIARYIEGDPYCMNSFIDNTYRKAVNIAFQMGGSGSSSDQIQMIGIIIYCLNRILKNRTINLFGCHNNDDLLYLYTPIITPSTDVVTPQIELILLNLKAFFRRVMFAVKEGAPRDIRKRIGIYTGARYGITYTIRKDKIIKYFGITPDIVINDDFRLDMSNIEATCADIVKKIVEAQDDKL